MYDRARARGAIRQGELFSGLTQAKLASTSLATGRLVIDAVVHDWALVSSQDCDLDWDFVWRFPTAGASALVGKELPNVLCCEGRAIPDGVRLPEFDRDIWRRIEQNQNVRYHLLPGVDATNDRNRVGTPALLLDFKRYFTIPTAELYQRCRMRAVNPEASRRRAVLRTPLREDVADRFFHYLARIALPEAMAGR